MSARLRELARHTEDIVHTGHYRSPLGHEVPVAAELAIALAGTRLHGPDPVPCRTWTTTGPPASR